MLFSFANAEEEKGLKIYFLDVVQADAAVIPCEGMSLMIDGGNAADCISRFMRGAIFLLPAPQILQKVITGPEDLYQHDLNGLDMQRDLYEYMLGKLSTAGKMGNSARPGTSVK